MFVSVTFPSNYLLFQSKLSNMFYNVDAIKRKARKEAWYGSGNEYNPFRKTTRSSTWSNPQKPQGAARDIEAGEDQEGMAHLSNIQTEPIPESPRYMSSNEKAREVKDEEHHMTTAGPSISNGRTSDPSTEETVVARQITPSSAEVEKKGVFSRFHKKGKKSTAGETEVDDMEKKRPWYKGKVLPHEPFTLRNQLGATLFNSWINVLLIAAPVGIALEYAGMDGKIVFCVNFIAIIPLAAMLSFATEEIALHVGESLGGLLNASFGYVLRLYLKLRSNDLFLAMLSR